MTRLRIAKTLWESATPYVQIFGWLVLVAGVIFSGGIFYQNEQSAITDVQALKSWKEQESVNIADIQREVHDIHDFIMPQRMTQNERH